MPSRSDSHYVPPTQFFVRNASEATYVESSDDGHARKWIPDPEAKWSDPNHPLQTKRPRTLVLCFDGTGDQFDDDVSNVVRFMEALKKDDQQHQLVYYQTGIGTYTNPNIVTPVLSKLSKTLDLMFAWNLGSHVMSGYSFLMQNYTAGDKICIFGFSRGAYVARSLAGMLARVGLLPSCNTQQIPFAWAMYKREDERSWRDSADFKKTFSIDVKIEFVGVWDTVASVGIIPRELPFVKNNSSISYFRHALALDERRAKFAPNFYHACNCEGAAADIDHLVIDRSKAKDAQPLEANVSVQSAVQDEKHNSSETLDTPPAAKEVWFAGCHSDVGGGSVKNNTRHSLARIPLRWMIRECFACQTGIIFDADILREKIGMATNTLYPTFKPRESKRMSPGENQEIRKCSGEENVLWGFIKFIFAVLVFLLGWLYKILTFPLWLLWILARYSYAGHQIHERIGVPAKEALGRWWKEISRSRGKRQSVSDLEAGKPKDENHVVSEEEEDLHDALSPGHDQLHIRWMWWIVEYIPIRFRNQAGSREDFYIRLNRGKGRFIYGDATVKGIKVHSSVKTRLEVVNGDRNPVYKPRAIVIAGPRDKQKLIENWNIDNPAQWEWVD